MKNLLGQSRISFHCTGWGDEGSHPMKIYRSYTHVEKACWKNDPKLEKANIYLYIYIYLPWKQKKHQHISSNSMRFQDSGFVLSERLERRSTTWNFAASMPCWKQLLLRKDFKRLSGDSWMPGNSANVTFLGWWKRDVFSMANRDLQLVDQKVTLNHLVCFFFLFPMVGLPELSPSLEKHVGHTVRKTTPFGCVCSHGCCKAKKVPWRHVGGFLPKTNSWWRCFNIATKFCSHRMREWSISNCVPLSSIGVSCVFFFFLSAYQWFPIIEKTWGFHSKLQSFIINTRLKIFNINMFHLLRFLQTNVYDPLQVTNPPFGVAVSFRQRKALKLLSFRSTREQCAGGVFTWPLWLSGSKGQGCWRK